MKKAHNQQSIAIQESLVPSFAFDEEFKKSQERSNKQHYESFKKKKANKNIDLKYLQMVERCPRGSEYMKYNTLKKTYDVQEQSSLTGIITK